ncbi:MAG: hypothetical protein ABWZ52_06245, partial [Acidimicrobiales bacterium]
MPPLDPLPPVMVEAIELLRVPVPLVLPLRTAGAEHAERDVLLVHVRAAASEGWAECAVEPQPTYGPEFTDATVLALRDHLVPRALRGPTGDGLALGKVLGAVRGHQMARAALQLAVLDAQLRADR